MSVKKVGDDPGTVLRVTCRRCGSILEYHRRDVKEHTYKDYSGVSDTDHYITCPTCEHRVVVKPR